MKKRIGLGLVLIVLLALFGAQAFAGDEGASKGSPNKTSALEFKVFDTQSLLEEWGVYCSNGSTSTCSGSMEYCLGYCEGFCGGPCTCSNCEQVPQQN